MRRCITIIALALAFGSGIVVGSLCLGVAHADTPPVGTAELNPGVPYNPPGTSVFTNTYPIYPRWQVLVLPGVNRAESVVMLLDSQLGSTYILRLSRTNPAGYSWEHVSR